MKYFADHDVVLISQVLMVGNVSPSICDPKSPFEILCRRNKASVVFASSHQLVTDGVRGRSHAGKSIHVRRHRLLEAQGPRDSSHCAPRHLAFEAGWDN